MAARATLTWALLAVAASAAPSANTAAVCDALFQRFPARISYDPLGPNGYKTLNQLVLWQQTLTDYWNGDNADNRPGCMFFPGSAAEVSYAVQQLNKYDNVPFALKSGGHNPNKGFSSVDSGVMISFRPNLASTSISADRLHADVGPGSRWEEALTMLDAYGKAIVGGRLGHVGVGGYVLGGGLSFLTGEYGFACDLVTNYELVLADGTITNANATNEPDLFYALKGGGNQFGIVTKFTFRTIPMGSQIWGGTRMYDGPASRQALFAATQKFTREFKDPKAAVIVTYDFTLASLTNVVVVFYFYNGPVVPPGVLDDFFAIPYIQSDTMVQSYPSLLKANNKYSVMGFRYNIREATYPNLAAENMTAFYEKYWQTYKDFTTRSALSSLDFQILSFAVQPIPAGMQKASNDAGGNLMGLDPAHGDLIFMEHDISWLNPGCDDACPGNLRDLVNGLEDWQHSTFQGYAPTNYQSGDLDFVPYNPIFMNDGQTGQKVLQSYGAETYAKLKAIQLARDKKGFFTKRQDGFKFDT